MEKIFAIMLACKKYVSTCGAKKVLQWNLDITKCQGTGKMCLLKRGFIISNFFFYYWGKETEDFVKYRGLLYRGSTAVDRIWYISMGRPHK